jgi:DNA-binding transcriptional LysR family regulator
MFFLSVCKLYKWQHKASNTFFPSQVYLIGIAQRAMSQAHVETRHLRYFVAVAEELSLRAASLRLHISQPPLTRQIQQLEDMLGVALFSRNARGVELTAAGQAFLTDARNVLGLLDQACHRATLVGHGKLGRLDIGVFGSSTFSVVPRIVLRFRQAHPEVEVVMHNLGKSEQIKALHERRISIGFNRLVQSEPDITVETFLSEGLHVVLRRGAHPIRRKELRVADLKTLPLIIFPRLPRPSFADRVINLCRQSGFEPDVVQEVDDVVTALALVAAGFGVCVVPDSALHLRLPGLSFVPLEQTKGTTVDLCCLYRTSDDSILLKTFLEYVRESGR